MGTKRLLAQLAILIALVLTAGVATGHEHADTDESCFICDPALRDLGRLWCTEHARYEDRCWDCQPQLEDKDRLYCGKHGLYEDECFLCHPELVSTASGPALDALFCNEHQVTEIECGICQPQRAGLLAPGEELKVRFESSVAAAKAGLSTERPTESRISATVDAICEIRYDQNSLARVTPFAAGIVRRVLVDVGATVNRGDILVELHSAELAEARASFVSAMVDAELKTRAWEREESLASRSISSEKSRQEAEAAHRTSELAQAAARQRLENYGLSDEEILGIAETGDASASLLVRAPYAGTLVERDAVVGELVDPGEALFTLADLSRMWLALAVAAPDAHRLEPGMPVRATFGGSQEIEGELVWISPAVDERTRRVNARAVVDNTAGELRAGMFGEARVFLASANPALSVPIDAVQYLQGEPHVLVRHEADLYGVRRVEGSRIGDGRFAVTAGLAPDDDIVVEGAFTALSEFLKSRLGAGCADD